MREMSADRPDKTESSYTVDAGHVQIEADFASYTQDTTYEGNVRTTARVTNYATTNVKVGLTNSVDFQLILSPYILADADSSDAKAVSNKGFGDTVVRLKVNFMGNDGGDFSVGIMPFLKFPTSSGGVGNNAVEGGVDLPANFALPFNWGLGTMLIYNRALNDDDTQFHNEFAATASASHDLFGDLGFYVELAGQQSDLPGAQFAATIDGGLTYAITPDFQLDAGGNFALTEAADDLNLFTGITPRF